MVAPEYPPATGGMETHAGETARRLRDRGHRVTVLTRAGQRPAPAGAVPAEAILDRRFGRARRAIVRRAREERAEAILLMNAGYAPIAALSAPHSLPVLARTVGNDAYGAWHGPRLPLRFLFWRLPHAQPASLGARLRRRDQEQRVAAVLAGLQRCAAILCNSRYTQGRLASLGVDAGRLRLLVGGVDPDAYHPGPEPRRFDAAAPVLGTAGRLKPIKGFGTAIEALAILRRRGIAARLLVAGSGPDEATLRARAGAERLDGAVEFLGDLPADRMPEFFRRLDVYLQPSIEVRHEQSGAVQAESMGRALLEAQASGVPVVASRSGGILDVVEEDRTGRLVPPGDAAALAVAVAALCGDPAARARLADAGRRAVEERFSWDAVVRETEREIERAIAARPV
jgi:phosphatidyl-myo-inositol dimannoside synthase